jgi:hypothetical protein
MLKIFDRCKGHLFHDWECLDNRSKSWFETDIVNSYPSEETENYRRKHRESILRVKTKVCLRCQKISDGVEEFKTEIVKGIENSIKRNRKAKEIIQKDFDEFVEKTTSKSGGVMMI